ncbi:MAG: hypothetical protein HSCHL_1346 [Hydrogenibacillus schlegelii]|uniref:Uncharacterized protein n=1 Tax=Hydrogenibacillus schlegelii TaxID=1484 RepID=A0A2T5G5D4_HYDSH|nr:MAG: hypothetical protein HSCHL_1346 [Hydrogenibacillus schlegelii]
MTGLPIFSACRRNTSSPGGTTRITLLHPRSLSPLDRVRLAPVFRMLREYSFIRSLTPDGDGKRPDSRKPRL